MKILVFLEHQGGELTRGSAGLLAKAVGVADEPVAAVLAGGPEVDALAAEAGKFGAARVHVARHDALDPPLPQPRIDVMERIALEGGYDTFLFSNSVLGADVAAGLAARLGAGLNWDLVDMARSGGGSGGQAPGLSGHRPGGCRLAGRAAGGIVPPRFVRSDPGG